MKLSIESAVLNCFIYFFEKSNVARFVSMIPFVTDSLIFPGICDVWSTCDVRILFYTFSFKLVLY
jgi:hypothetical protein